MKDESFCIEFASSLALMLLELNAELLDLADEDVSTTSDVCVVELERVPVDVDHLITALDQVVCAIRLDEAADNE